MSFRELKSLRKK